MVYAGADQDAATTVAGRSSESLERVIASYVKQQRREARRLETLYPADPPNRKCRTAVIGGLLLSNGAGLRAGNTYRYFTCDLEKAYVWTHTVNEYSALIVKVDPLAKKGQKVWKTLASILQIAGSLSSAFEHIRPCSYHWIYRFRPEVSLADQDFYQEFDAMEAKSGSIHNLWFLAELAPLTDLLARDDAFFAAAQQYYSSITSHWFCLQCELGPSENVHHPSHEPEEWEKVSILPHLDTSLVQACRVVETLVGQPGGNEKRALQRWKDAVDLDPNAVFAKARKPYMRYFRDVYQDRNKAAHGRATVKFNATRQNVITAQCLAWEILSSYASKHARSPEQAKRTLRFNQSLLRHEIMPEYTTKMTDPKYHAQNLRRAAKVAQSQRRGSKPRAR